jgi:hypothetical protein
MTQKKQAAYFCVACFVNIVNNLLFEVTQGQGVDETKMQWFLRNLQGLRYPEMPDSKGF